MLEEIPAVESIAVADVSKYLIDIIMKRNSGSSGQKNRLGRKDQKRSTNNNQWHHSARLLQIKLWLHQKVMTIGMRRSALPIKKYGAGHLLAGISDNSVNFDMLVVYLIILFYLHNIAICGEMKYVAYYLPCNIRPEIIEINQEEETVSSELCDFIFDYMFKK